MATKLDSQQTPPRVELINESDGASLEAAKLYHRIMVDLRMLPLLGTLYALALIDRTNLGLARIVGMDHDLGLSIGSRYSIVSSIYFIPYILFQLPSNLLLRPLGVRNWLAFCATAWGMVQLAMGFVPSWKYLAVCRLFLGAFEAGFFPALVFVITTWYTRYAVQKRLAAFYLLSILAGGFSAILGYAISLLQGKQGLAGWAWIFIIEGAITMLFGIMAWFYMPDFPDKNTFLDPQETELVLKYVELDRGDALPDPLNLEKVVFHLKDWKIWVLGLMYMCATIPAYAIGFFITLILRGMGWSITQSLLLSAPPYVFAATSIMFFAWLSDMYRQRALFIAIQAVLTLIGMVLIGYSVPPGWRYAGIFLGNAGSAGCIPGILAYSANNTVSHSKRGVGTAVIITFGGIGGIFATTVFRQQDAPGYVPGIIATIVCQIALLVFLGIMTLTYSRKNHLLQNGVLEEPLEGQRGFLYTL